MNASPGPSKYPSAVVFGAGKIARGFIAHLLQRAAYNITFVERSAELTRMLRERGKYRILVLGDRDQDTIIDRYRVLQADETDNIAEAVHQADIVFVSIGGANLPQISDTLVRSFAKIRNDDPTRYLNIILCENYYRPAQWLRDILHGLLDEPGRLWLETNVGIAEALVLRSCIEPTEEMRSRDPLSLQVQNAWHLPVNGEAFVGTAPSILGVDPQSNFEDRLTQKLFTYNAINAVVCYLGHLKGYKQLSEAANDPEISNYAEQAGREATEALCQRYRFEREDQVRFADSALAKYRREDILDPIERNARDPLRKLGRNDRLVGPAALALETGVQPIALVRAIAAALLYRNPGDEASVQLERTIRTGGVQAALQKVCGLDPNSQLTQMVLRQYAELQKMLSTAVKAEVDA